MPNGITRIFALLLLRLLLHPPGRHRIRRRTHHELLPEARTSAAGPRPVGAEVAAQ
ncbi:hypothetical protein [Streptomyces tubercidicus]|uniref:hypothetical protein n=1 Tax=Streptomyces tubercidicus TaxID=47759 RepID=UPI0036B56A70